MGVVIYVDILIFLNTVVDYLILSATETLCKTKMPFLRKLSAAFLSALTSLYIFLPALPFAVELLMRLFSSVLAVTVGFGFGGIKRYMRRIFTFYAASFIYAGLMSAIYMLLKPSKMSVNNGVVYFDISPLVLITVSFVIYLTIVVAKKLFGKEAPTADRCEICLVFQSQTVNCTAMVDSGHTLHDGFGNCAVIIIEQTVAEQLFGEKNTESMLKLDPPEDLKLTVNFRVVPIRSVAGEKLLPAVKIKSAEVTYDGRRITLEKPLTVLTENRLGDDYSAIISPEILT